MTHGRQGGDGASDPESAGGGASDPEDPDAPTPSDAFGALGGETRLAVVRALDTESPRAFSDLAEATDADTTAGFAYHLRRLTERFVRQREDERYELTDAGRSVARAVAAGTYTASVDRDPVELDEPCPLCDGDGLVAAVADNVTEVGCGDCGGTVLRLSLPPGGYAARDSDEFADAVDAHHRRRIESFDDGVCPECTATVSARIEPAEDEADHGASHRDDEYVPVQTVYECETCGADLRCPVALTLLDHPAVVAFYHDHDRDVRDRPIWNVGSEWRERAVSRDPWCIVVSVRLDGEVLVCYVAGDGRVVDHRRESREEPSARADADDSATGTHTDDSTAVSTDDAETVRANDTAESGPAES
ncbi:ArsR family transcriptional regulator [Halosimplex carlsbadense 2-9-1]|uniref:ArsR family transcriptional regulator n=1 Tax=Halosimplex carlsbadense 2-9-1 TaxID=797114 RepID=M0CQS6_9EURY|nr:winged helix-turn-helix domain-containing protein [Halosimplex carlsbadense]ELZ25571.1 ArsR family transcriptional regulator [Halosimplex carlsbadense 2-9-1]